MYSDSADRGSTIATRDPSRTPLFQVMFALQNAPVGTVALPGVEAALLAVETGIAKFDLTLILEEAPGGGLSGVLEHSTDLFEEATAARDGARKPTWSRVVACSPAAASAIEKSSHSAPSSPTSVMRSP